MNNFEFVQKAQATLAKNPNDREAQFVVDLFNASETLYKKTKTLQAEVDTVREELSDANRENADYARKIDMLESKVHAAESTTGSVPFSASAFMESMFAMTAAAAE